MNYIKPEITSLVSASSKIQALVGKTTVAQDSKQIDVTTTNAYEADE